jgi:hypothetical protein
MGEKEQPKDRPSAKVTTVSTSSEWPSPIQAMVRHIAPATVLPSRVRKRYLPVALTAWPARKLPMTLPSVIAIIRSPASLAESPPTSW